MQDPAGLFAGSRLTDQKLGQRKLSKDKMAEAERSSAVQFSGGEKEVIERKLDDSTDALHTRKDINDFYEISRCVDVIKSRGFEKVITTLFQFFQTLTTLSLSLTDVNTEKSFCYVFRKYYEEKKVIVRVFWFIPKYKFSSLPRLSFCQQRKGFIPVSPHDEFAPTEFAPTSTELDRVRPQPDRVRPQTDRVRPQTDCVPFHVSEVLNREFF